MQPELLVAGDMHQGLVRFLGRSLHYGGSSQQAQPNITVPESASPLGLSIQIFWAMQCPASCAHAQDGNGWACGGQLGSRLRLPTDPSHPFVSCSLAGREAGLHRLQGILH